MAEFFQYLVNGISAGSIYALLAVGLTLIFGIARVGNFAHGDVVMVAAYTVIILIAAGIPLVVAVSAAIATAAGLSLALELLVFRRLAKAPTTTPFVAALGISVVIQASVISLLDATPRYMPLAVTLPPVQLGEVILTGQRALAIVGSLAAMLALDVFLRSGRFGKAIRAVAQNVEAARMVGIPLPRIRLITMLVAGLLAGLAAVLVAPIFGAQPTMAVLLTLKSFAIVILAGLGSVRGALVGAYLLGVTEALFAGYFATGLRDAIAFVLLAGVLLLRPGGLFGEGTVAMELRR